MKFTFKSYQLPDLSFIRASPLKDELLIQRKFKEEILDKFGGGRKADNQILLTSSKFVVKLKMQEENT